MILSNSNQVTTINQQSYSRAVRCELYRPGLCFRVARQKQHPTLPNCLFRITSTRSSEQIYSWAAILLHKSSQASERPQNSFFFVSQAWQTEVTMPAQYSETDPRLDRPRWPQCGSLFRRELTLRLARQKLDPTLPHCPFRNTTHDVWRTCECCG